MTSISVLSDFWVHTVTVETYTGENTNGPMFAAPVQVTGFLDTTADLARSTAGDEATSARSMFYTDPANAGLFTVQSRVTASELGGDGKATVIKVNSLTSGPLGLPDHAEIGLL